MARLKTATRTVHNAGRNRVIGVFTSVKDGTRIVWESLPERDFFYCCEFDQRVISYQPQPETITLWIDGRCVRYTPDVRVNMLDGSCAYFEIKLDKEIIDPDLEQVYAAAEIHYARQQDSFQVVDASDFRRGYLIENIRLLHYYATWPVSTRQVTQLLELFSPGAHTSVPLGEVRYRAASLGISPGAIYICMFRQVIGADLGAMRINEDMPVWSNGL